MAGWGSEAARLRQETTQEKGKMWCVRKHGWEELHKTHVNTPGGMAGLGWHVCSAFPHTPQLATAAEMTASVAMETHPNK